MTFSAPDRGEKKRENKYIRTVHLACTFHSLVGCKQAKQLPNTQANDPCWPEHTGWVQSGRHREASREDVRVQKGYRGTASRPYLRNDTVGSAKRKPVPQPHRHSQQIALKLFELSFLGTRVLLYGSEFCGTKNSLWTRFWELWRSKQSEAYPYVALADLAQRIKCLTPNSYIHLVSSSGIFWWTSCKRNL